MSDELGGGAYEPLSLTALARLMAGAEDAGRWRLVVEFLEDYRWERLESRMALLEDEPHGTGDERWDVSWQPWRSIWLRGMGVADQRGRTAGRLGSCGSRLTLVLPGLMLWFTLLRPSAAAGCT